MNRHFNNRSTGIFAVALIVMASLLGLSLASFMQLRANSQLVQHTQQVAHEIDQLGLALLEAESRRRAHALTLDASHAEQVHAAVAIAYEELAFLQRLTADNARQQERLVQLRPLLDARVDNLHRALQAVRDSGINENNRLDFQRDLTDEGIKLTKQVQAVLTDMRNEEFSLLAGRKSSEERQSLITIVILLLGGAGGIVLLVLSFVSLNRQATARLAMEQSVKDANARLTTWASELERRNRDMAALREATYFLQACRSLSEASNMVLFFMDKNFSDISGALCLMKPSRNALSVQTIWGAASPPGAEFEPDDCWALRKGQPHRVSGGGVRCKHLAQSTDDSYCVPMLAQGDIVGLLIVTGRLSEEEGQYRLLELMAEALGLALSNIALREKLLNQAISDPLTGLFNRRYMEETLLRELSRAQRGQSKLGVILIDVDHFKKFNDIHGHQAGDEVLKVLGKFLKTSIRGSDIACRYGGEEFALVLPEATLESATERAKLLSEKIRFLSLEFNDVPLGNITLSLGISLYPEHGESPQSLLLAADMALYRAKSEGRDRVCVANAAGPVPTPALYTPGGGG